MVPDHSALSLDSRGNFVSEYDKDDIETAGLIKFDLLGLENLSILSCANLLVKKRTGSLVNIRSIPKEDPKVFSLINQNITLGVFQIESQGMRSLISQLQPENINELAVLSALFRPGALQSGMVEDYVDTKHNRKALTYDHPEMEAATKETYGCIVFQEQVMSVVRHLAGYSLGGADQLRRAMGKKKIEEMIRHKTVFTKSAQQYWRSDFIAKGKSKFTEFELDPNIEDLADRFPDLKLNEIIFEGYFSEVSKVESYLTGLLGLGKESSEKLHTRLLDINYTVKIFKGDYQEGIFTAVSALLPNANDIEVSEVQTRLFFALAQWVRFNCIFNKIEKFAGYGFNKSHAIGYSLITYATAYFKTHYPPEFYASTMSFAKLEDIDPLAKEAISKMQVPILKPDVNKSLAMFTTEGKSNVRYGLSKLAGVASSGGAIEAARGDSKFTSLVDFISRFNASSGKKVAKGTVYGLALTGGFDEFIPTAVANAQGVNGRLFVYELVMNLKDSVLMNHIDNSNVDGKSIHANLKELEMIDIIAYWLTSMPVKQAKSWLDVSDMDDDAETNDGTKLKGMLESFMSAVCINLQKPKAKSEFIQNDKSQYEFHYDKIRSLISSLDVEVEEFLLAKFQDGFKMSLVDTVNEEKRICGMYLTMSPLDAIDAFNKVEREPPSSMVDGCPIRLSDIDEDVDGESVMTVGVIRGVISKQVMNPESDYFTQKILEFHLEDGLDLVKFSIFGTRAVDKMSEFIVEGGIIMAVGKVKHSEKYGISVGLEAFKRYHPEMDDVLTKVPRTRRF
jgi:DNA polymerase III alpha subunit